MLTASIICLATAIQHEARGESLRGQIAVGQVIINRVESAQYPDSVCKVVHQRKQFSHISKAKKPTQKFIDLAFEMMTSCVYSGVGNRLYFNHYSLGKRYKTNWTALKIDNHLFF